MYFSGFKVSVCEGVLKPFSRRKNTSRSMNYEPCASESLLRSVWQPVAL